MPAPAPARAGKHNAGRSPVDFQVPRELIYCRSRHRPARCPRCGGMLQQTLATFALATRQAGDMAAFVIGSDFGWFCLSCPVVVVEYADAQQFVRYASGNADEWALLGLLDPNALPTPDGIIPLGSKGERYPVVQFSHTSTLDVPSASAMLSAASKAKRAARARQGRKRGR